MIEDLQNEKIIISKTSSNLILIYFNPQNWGENDNGEWVFDCDFYISILPSSFENRIKINDDPHPNTGKITDTVVHRKDWYTKKEGLPIIFETIFE